MSEPTDATRTFYRTQSTPWLRMMRVAFLLDSEAEGDLSHGFTASQIFCHQRIALIDNILTERGETGMPRQPQEGPVVRSIDGQLVDTE